MSAPAAKSVAAPQHHGADVLALGGLARSPPELDADGVRDRVRRRTVQADDADPVVDLQVHELPHRARELTRRRAPEAASSVVRRPSRSGVRRTPKAAAASGASARLGRPSHDAATASIRIPSRPRETSAAACPSAWVGGASSPRSRPASPSAVIASGPSSPHVPAGADPSSSIAATTAAEVVGEQRGDRLRRPVRTTNGGSASAPSTAAVNQSPPSP